MNETANGSISAMRWICCRLLLYKLYIQPECRITRGDYLYISGFSMVSTFRN